MIEIADPSVDSCRRVQATCCRVGHDTVRHFSAIFSMQMSMPFGGSLCASTIVTVLDSGLELANQQATCMHLAPVWRGHLGGAGFQAVIARVPVSSVNTSKRMF